MDAYGQDIGMGFAIGIVTWLVANVTVLMGLANVTVLHWSRMYHGDVRLPRGLPKIGHQTRMRQIDLCHCSDQVQHQNRPRPPR